jgi:hypothetical protein
MNCSFSPLISSFLREREQDAGPVLLSFTDNVGGGGAAPRPAEDGGNI